MTDPAPLWTPAEEQTFLRAAKVRPPANVDGWTPLRMVIHFFLASPRRAVARIGLLIAAVLVVLALPSLASSSDWGNLGRVAWYHGFTLALGLAVTTRVRTIGLRDVLRYWVLGTAAAVAIVYYLSGPLIDLIGSSTPNVWVVPQLEELTKLAVVALVLLFATSRLRHPGVADLVVLGYAVGAGFAFHEDALWGRSTSSGFEAPFGLVVPSFFQPGGGVLIVAHAAWTAIAALGLGLLVLHWRRPLAAVAGIVLVAAPILDHMIVNSRDTSFDWALHLLFDHRLTAWLLIGGIIVAIFLDRQVLAAHASRDHLLEPVRTAHLYDQPDDGALAVQLLVAGRYRRARNAVYFSRHRERQRWPTTRSRATDATLASLARTGRVVGLFGALPVATRGWDTDPVDPSRTRWFTPAGWSPYVYGEDGPAVHPAPGRPTVRAETRYDPPPGWAKVCALVAGVVGIAIAIRVLTMPEAAQGGFSLAPDPGLDTNPLQETRSAAPGLDVGGHSLPSAPGGPGDWTLPAGGGAFGGAGDGPGPAPDDDSPPDDEPPEDEC